MKKELNTFIKVESTSISSYIIEQIIFGLFAWVPSLVGIILRSIIYRMFIKSDGIFFIQSGTILKQVRNIYLHDGVYLDHGVYLHACPNGIEIGSRSRVMYTAELHVLNFRDLPNAGIVIGRDCVIGPGCIMYGQGGIKIGDNVLLSPKVSIFAVNHISDDREVLIADQGIEAKGVEIGDNVWIGGGAVILDGVKVGHSSIVAAGAVVTKDVPPLSIIAGNPAIFLKSRK